jgi:hypothetical protein
MKYVAVLEDPGLKITITPEVAMISTENTYLTIPRPKC